jgi:outer membrane protein assembly factor BamB
VSTGGSPATGTVFVGSNDGNVSALDAGTGERHWRFQTGDTVRSSPTVANVSAGTGPATGQTVFVGSNDGHVYALDADPTWSNGSHLDGDARWRFETGGPVRSSPTVANVSSGPTTVFVGSDDGHVYALDAATGAKRWEYNTGDPIQSSPTAANLDAGAGADGWTVFVGSGDENLHALNATTGTEQWQFVTGGVVRSSPTVANGTVLVGSDDNRLYAVDGATGEFEWRVFTSGAVEVSPVVVNGTVFVGNLDGNVYALDTDAAASSDGSRVTRGTLGHHYAWADQDVVGPPRVIGGGWPRDPSGDGLFEDVRGDGTVDIFDVQTLFVNLDSPAVQNNAAFYNFQEQNADEVTIFDVQALFTSVTSA